MFIRALDKVITVVILVDTTIDYCQYKYIVCNGGFILHINKPPPVYLKQLVIYTNMGGLSSWSQFFNCAGAKCPVLFYQPQPLSHTLKLKSLQEGTPDWSLSISVQGIIQMGPSVTIYGTSWKLVLIHNRSLMEDPAVTNHHILMVNHKLLWIM